MDKENAGLEMGLAYGALMQLQMLVNQAVEAKKGQRCYVNAEKIKPLVDTAVTAVKTFVIK